MWIPSCLHALLIACIDACLFFFGAFCDILLCPLFFLGLRELQQMAALLQQQQQQRQQQQQQVAAALSNTQNLTAAACTDLLLVKKYRSQSLKVREGAPLYRI